MDAATNNDQIFNGRTANGLTPSTIHHPIQNSQRSTRVPSVGRLGYKAKEDNCDVGDSVSSFCVLTQTHTHTHPLKTAARDRPDRYPSHRNDMSVQCLLLLQPMKRERNNGRRGGGLP